MFVQILVRNRDVVSAVVVRTSENQFAPANLLGLDKFRQVAKITQPQQFVKIFFNALEAFLFTR
jgi:hypothetical protein